MVAAAHNARLSQPPAAHTIERPFHVPSRRHPE
jgi:hypothetical protein